MKYRVIQNGSSVAWKLAFYKSPDHAPRDYIIFGDKMLDV